MVTFPIGMECKETGLSEAERLGECSMPVTINWGSSFPNENICQSMSVMVLLQKFYRANTALVFNGRKILNYLIRYLKSQLGYVPIIKDSLQLVGQNFKPKTDDKGVLKNWGFPKGCKSYLLTRKGRGRRNIVGNGGFVVSNLLLPEGSQLFNIFNHPTGRYYSSGRKKIAIPVVKREIECSYKQLFDIDIYKEAYLKVRSNAGNMSPGGDKETLDGVSLEWADGVIKRLKDRTFQFNPSRRVFIEKANGNKRPLGIPSPRDKVIQQALKMILESVFEPIFLNTSHGFRPKRSTTTAVFEVRKWNGVTWIIEGDIKGYFDNVDHHILASFLQKMIKDKNLIDLYWKLVKAGYVNNGKHTVSHLGVPQGGIISPFLSNVYLHELDLFMETIIAKYSTWDKKVSKRNPEYYKVKFKLKKLKEIKNPDIKQVEDIKYLTKELSKLPSVIRTVDTGTRIYYNRYADDWLIGISGDLDLARKIREEVQEFLLKTLKLELNVEKTKITHVAKKKINYLGFLISRRSRRYTESQVSFVKSTGQIRRPSFASVIIEAPIDKLIDKLIDLGFSWHDKRPKAITKWIYMQPKDIIRRYNWMIRGILNYYKSVENRNQMSYIMWILKFSAVFTLAKKLNISPRQIWKKFGNPITIKVVSEDKKEKKVKKIVLFEPSTLKRDRTFQLDSYFNFDPFNVKYFDVRSNHLWDANCSICGSEEQVEMHHVKHIRKGKVQGFTQIMQNLNRKQIPVCRSCHMKIHSGAYDGIALNKLKVSDKS